MNIFNLLKNRAIGLSKYFKFNVTKVLTIRKNLIFFNYLIDCKYISDNSLPKNQIKTIKKPRFNLYNTVKTR